MYFTKRPAKEDAANASSNLKFRAWAHKYPKVTVDDLSTWLHVLQVGMGWGEVKVQYRLHGESFCRPHYGVPDGDRNEYQGSK